jgi:H+-transporting ATPase
MRRCCSQVCGARPGNAQELSQLQFLPFDPVHKRTEATVVQGGNPPFKVSKGMPEVIFDLCKLDAAAMAKARSTVGRSRLTRLQDARGWRERAQARTTGRCSRSCPCRIHLATIPRRPSRMSKARAFA